MSFYPSLLMVIMIFHHLNPNFMALDFLSLEQIKTLSQNQLDFDDQPPITYRATFKLSKIIELIAEIVKHPDFRTDGDSRYNVCLTFVRDDFSSGSNPLNFSQSFSAMQTNSQTKGNRTLTQVIPIIIGCASDWNSNTFKYLRSRDDKGNEGVLFVRPGGEASGLIPPPPPPQNDESFK